MQNVDFNFDYECYGAAVIDIEVDKRHYKFTPTYMGGHPLTALITALWKLKKESLEEFIENGKTRRCDHCEQRLIWQDEPNGHALKLTKQGNKLHIVVNSFSDTEDYDGAGLMVDSELFLEFVTDFDDFTSKVCREAIRVVRNYGFAGYLDSWDDSFCIADDFPISKIMALLGNTENRDDNDLYFSDFDREIKLLTQNE